MKCSGKPDTTWTIPRSITFSPLHFMLYRGKSITFGTVKSDDLCLFFCIYPSSMLLSLCGLVVQAEEEAGRELVRGWGGGQGWHLPRQLRRGPHPSTINTSHPQPMLCRGESISPRFYNVCVRQFMQFVLFQPHFCSFALIFYLLASPRQDGRPRNRWRKKRRENETKKERIALTALLRNC